MAANLPVPVYTALDELYADLGTAANHAVRWNALAEDFKRRFGRAPAYIARAPGRVNLIGEHIDYALFGVLPAAVERDILIAIAPRAGSTAHGHVDAQNAHPKYSGARFAPARRASVAEDVHVEEWHLDIDPAALRWESYVKAGYYGVLNAHFPGSGAGAGARPVPVDLLVTGTVPAGSGLSSSAAMVVASTLAFLAANDRLDGLTKSALVGLAVANEKRVGVNSGGMDQAASVVCTSASALYVAFTPELTALPVRLPRAAFVIANSLVTSEKAAGAKTRYNLRVVETLAAARALCAQLGLPLKSEKERPTLREVVGRLGGEPEAGWVPGEDDGKLRAALALALEKAEVLRPEGAREGGELGVTLATMAQWCKMSDEAFHDVFLSWIEVEAEYFQLYKRTRHVLTEALRVLDFRDVCARAADTSSPSSHEDVLKELGALMDASMDSCSAVFECACPELDALCALARRAGAYGARLTGAGWGGCTVSLVDEDKVEGFIAALRAGYPAYEGLEGEKLAEVVFATKPSAGACVFKFEE